MEAVIDEAAAEFKAILRRELFDLEFEVNIKVDHDKYLEERSLHDNQLKGVHDYTVEDSADEVYYLIN